jgi:hypothetical protein
MYEINWASKKSRACSFGYGNRLPLARNTCTPSPPCYTLPSTITTENKSFGLSREEIKFQSFLLRALRSASGPSPNTYTLPSALLLRKITMGQRLPTDIDLKLTNSRVPPPNSYNLDAAGCASTGKYVSSRYKYLPAHSGTPVKSSSSDGTSPNSRPPQWVPAHVTSLSCVDSIDR